MATLAIFLFLFVLCAAVYAVGETINERIKLQNACDAAAYSAAAVQADGLSRMACVNRAMSWTYVQMSNRQMDYITYRWLWLTCKRFKEDRDNAHSFADHINIVCDKELGLWAILEVVASSLVDLWLKYPCDTGNHQPKNSDGHPWWAGQSGIDHSLVALNKFPAMPNVTTYTNLASLQSSLGSVFDVGGDAGSAALLGKLIDYDKFNIAQMNKALPRINYEMTRSMRETAENVLKATLTDNRLDSKAALSDFHISIHIPYAKNPYPGKSAGLDISASVESYFSPLRNTEPDERQFLQMHTSKFATKGLAAFFPKILVGNTSTAFGVDQWFVRGKGVYSGGEEASSNITATVRSEGEFGIQRVYKDTDLNESGAGLEVGDLVTLKEVFRGNHLLNPADFVKSGVQLFSHFIGGGAPLESEDDDKDDDPDKSDDDILDDSQTPEEIREKLEAQKASLEKEIQELERHVEETSAELTRLRNKISTLGPDDIDERGELEGQVNYYEIVLKGQMEKLSTAKTDLDQVNKDIEEFEKNKEDTIASGGGTGNNNNHGEASYGANKPGSGLGGFISDLFDSVLGFLGDKLMDIQPSCTHVHAKKDFTPPMCAKAKERTGLVSQYRWASCKWYCLTTAKAWLYSMIWNHKKIWCDREKHTFKRILRHKFKARGIGHFGFPKWFCGNKPDQPIKTGWGMIDKVLHRFPPFPVTDPRDPRYIITESHGYMETPFDIMGFIKPFKPLFRDEDGSSNGFHRKDYESCAQFMDGPFNFWKGRDSYAGVIRGHARIYGDDKEIFDNRYVGAKCMPWILNEKFFNGEGTIIVGAAKKFHNPFSQLMGFLGNEKAIVDYDKSVLSAFKIPKNNYMWTMSAARAAVRHRRRNGKFDKERMYQITYDPTSDVATLHYHDDKAVIYDHGVMEWRYDPLQTKMVEEDLAQDNFSPLIWDGCVCRTENEKRFHDIWNLCESDWDATLLPLRYSKVESHLYLSSSSGSERLDFMDQTIEERRNMIDYAHKCRERIKEDDSIGAGTNWVWSTTSNILDPQSCEINPFTDSWWKRATDDYFDVLNLGTHSLQFLPKASTLRDNEGKQTDNHYWNMFQLNRIL